MGKKRNIHVLIDGTLINKPRGIGRYVEELLRALATQPLDNLIISVLIPRGYSAPQSLVHEKIRYRQVSIPIFPLWEQFILLYWLIVLRPDVIHNPYNTHCWLSLLLPIKRVVTIHDLIFMDIHGGNRYQAIGNKYRTYCVRIVERFRSSYQVVTDSFYSQQIIQKSLGISSRVVYISVGDADCRDASILRTLGVKNKNYFLHIGGISPHKNTANTIAAYKATGLGNDFPLIVTGIPANAPIATSFRCENVIFPGWIATAQMRELTHGAIAVVFPSLIEGYGMPIVEAFSQGTPVITSDRPPMNELTNLASNPSMCKLVDPCDIEDIKLALLNVYNQSMVDSTNSIISVWSPFNMGKEMTSIYCGD